MMKHLSKLFKGALLGIAAALSVWILAKFLAPELFYTYEAKTYDWRIEKNFIDD